MSGLLGRGVLVNWGGVISGADADFNAWHSREHLPERLAVPGFLRGRRAIADPPAPDTLRYLMMYETETPEILVSAPYLARLNDPTPWTQRVLATYIAPCRTVCRVVHSDGHGTGGWLVSVAFAEDDRLEGLTLADLSLRQALLAMDDVIGVHVLEGDPIFGQQPTKEKRFREAQGQTDTTVAVVYLVDTVTSAAANAALAALSAKLAGVTPLHRLVYQTQHVVAPGDLGER